MLQINKIFIANRGEIARRIIRTAKKMNIKTVAVFNDVDKYSTYVKEADEAVHVSSAKNVFLDIETMIRVAKEHGSNAVHPGYGFLSENPLFSQSCKDNGIKFIGPSFDAMHLLSSKKDAKELAIQCGIPVVPGYNGHDQSLSAIKNAIQQIGFPSLLKATMGGGGRGMRVLYDNHNLDQIISMCSNEAMRHFGDGSLLVEKYLTRTRHLEIQVFGDSSGKVVHFGERECSLQRNYQKIIEEAPCFYLSNEERNQLYKWAMTILHHAKYEGAGTVEFICEEKTAGNRDFYFMEVNTRLQVEHLISQCINNNLDFVELQIRIAQGETFDSMGISSYCPPIELKERNMASRLSGMTNIEPINYSMECRVYNEDPSHDFLPGEGKVQFVNQIIDKEFTQVENNITILPTTTSTLVSFDPMLLKVITSGQTRKDVIERMKIALRRCHVFGVPTNIPFLMNALRLNSFNMIGADSLTVLEYRDSLLSSSSLSSFELAHTIAAFCFLSSFKETESSPSHSLPSLNRFCNSHSLTRYMQFQINEQFVECQISSRFSDPSSYSLSFSIDGIYHDPIETRLIENNDCHIHMTVSDELCSSYIYQGEGERMHVFPVNCENHLEETQYTIERVKSVKKMGIVGEMIDVCGDVFCPLPSMVSRVAVKNGDKVKKGDVLLVIDAMKMEHCVVAPQDGVVEMGVVDERQFFKKGQMMMRIV